MSAFTKIDDIMFNKQRWACIRRAPRKIKKPKKMTKYEALVEDKLTELGDAWKEYKNGGGGNGRFTKRLINAIKQTKVLKTDDHQKAILVMAQWFVQNMPMLVEITTRGEELDKHALDSFTNLLLNSPHTFKPTKDSGLLKAMLELCSKGRLCLENAARFFHLNLLKRYDACGKILVREGREHGVDLVKLIVEYLSASTHEKVSPAVVQVAVDLMRKHPVIELEDAKAILCVIKNYIKRGSLDETVGRCCEICIWEFCDQHLNTTTLLDLDPFLLDVQLFHDMWRFDVFETSSDYMYWLVRHLDAMSPALRTSLVESGLIETIARILQRTADDDNYHDNPNCAGIEHIILRRMTLCYSDRILGTVIECPGLRWNLLRSYSKGWRISCEFIHSLVIRYLARPPDLGNECQWPIIQFCLILYLDVYYSTLDIPGILLNVLRTTPISICVRELREFPIRNLLKELLNPTGDLLKRILDEPRFEEKASDLAWLPFAGCMDIDTRKYRKNIDLRHRKFPQRCRHRVRDVYVMTWAVGVASSKRLSSLAKAKHWLPPELWSLVWTMVWT